VLVPLLLIVPAVLAAGVVAYGTLPYWAQYAHGLALIMLTRRLQWPLVTFCVILCLGLVVMIIAGRRRAWWLIGLAPVLALLAHRFTTGAINSLTIVENPPFVPAEGAGAIIKDDDYVVGLVFGDTAYAFPYAQLYTTPVVLQSDQNRRLMLMWSAFANRATAYTIGRGLKARDLEIISMPANALLLYDGRLGQFINGVTARTKTGDRPNGFEQPLATSKLPWRQWRALYPNSRVMNLAPGAGSSVPVAARTPTAPVMPMYPLPRKLDLERIDANAGVALIGAEHPVAIPSEQLATTTAPLNVSVGTQLLLVFRDPARDAVRAFDRHIWEDMSPRFSLNRDAKRVAAGAYLIDHDTATGWSAAGVAVDGDKEHKGFKLAPVAVEDGLYWGVMRTWYPELPLYVPPTSMPSDDEPKLDQEKEKSSATHPGRRRRSR
jgi:hypothetical protein